MDRQVLGAFFDELEKIGEKKWDPIRGRPVTAVKTNIKPIPPMLPVIQTRPTPPEDLDFLVSQGML